MNFAALYPADTDAADIIVIVNSGNQNLQRTGFVALRRVKVIDNRFKQRHKIGTRMIRRKGSCTIAA